MWESERERESGILGGCCSGLVCFGVGNRVISKPGSHIVTMIAAGCVLVIYLIPLQKLECVWRPSRTASSSYGL